ncbi:uncharacterized protein LOC129740153 isoform X2 [Uranotaenia lowii]|uniref:uncharacterized protein LOC129740153 isoform X2 n=1 Tax=Uranotaenia lowii TaxID=190385 RepID=UPI002478A01A|nr:uncharacterized protein LOC129740153 isoform X2 [Uranotaenia lowii]
MGNRQKMMITVAAIIVVFTLLSSSHLVSSISVSPESSHLRQQQQQNPQHRHHPSAAGLRDGGPGNTNLATVRRYASGGGPPAAIRGAARLPPGAGGGGGKPLKGSGPPPRAASRSDNLIPQQLANQTSPVDRYRRLIPYMTFYIPSTASAATGTAGSGQGDFNLPINQAYNYMPIRSQQRPQEQPIYHHSNKQQILSLHQYQRQPQQLGSGHGGEPPLMYQSYQPQGGSQRYSPSSGSGSSSQGSGVKTILINNSPIKYDYGQRHQLAPSPLQPTITSNNGGAILYRAKTSSSSGKLYAIEIPKPQPSIQPNGISTNSGDSAATPSPNYQPISVYKKYQINPFLPSNKLPGQFTPIAYGPSSSAIAGGDHQGSVDAESAEESEPYPIPKPAPASGYNRPKQHTTYVLVKPSPEPNQLYYQEKPARPTAVTSYKEKINYVSEDDLYKSISKPIPIPKPSYLEESDDYRPIAKPIAIIKASYPDEPETYKHKLAPMQKPSYQDELEVYKIAPKPIPVPIPVAVEYSTPRPVPVYVDYSTPRPNPLLKESHGNAQSHPVPTTARPKYSHRPKSHKHTRVSTKAPPLRQHLTENVNPSDIRSPNPNYFDHYSEYKTHVKQNYYAIQPNYIPTPKPTKTTKLIPAAAAAPPSPQPSQHHEEPETHRYVVQSRPVYRPPPTPTQIVDTASSSGSTSLADLLKKLQDSNHLPKTLTPDNIDNSIRTLVKILNNLKASHQAHNQPSQAYPEDHQEEEHYQPKPLQKPSPPTHVVDEVEEDDHRYSLPPKPTTVSAVGSTPPGPNSGRPGIDYPNLAEIPETSFSCKEQRYKGFFGDPETNCQVWHYCDLNGGKASFLCPNGTIFSQVALTCDWWFNVKCSTTAQLYVLNERLYKYILPFTPKFPEDYSGPLVDKYLAIKFQEMEEKMKQQRAKGKAVTKAPVDNENDELNGNKLEDNDNRYNQNQPHPIQYVTENSLEPVVAAGGISGPTPEPIVTPGQLADDHDGAVTPITLEDIDKDYVRGRALAVKGPIVVTAPSAPTSSTGTEDYEEPALGPLGPLPGPIVLHHAEEPATDAHYASSTGSSVSTSISSVSSSTIATPTSSGPPLDALMHTMRGARIEVKHDGTSGHLTPTKGYDEDESRRKK